MKDKKAFGKFISEKRRLMGLTQAELAERLYVTKTAVSKWERGVTYPDITLITALCDALEVDEHELIAEGEGGKYDKIRMDAKRLRKIDTVYFWGLTAAYCVAAAVCLICNLAVKKTLDWFFIVLAALATAFCLFPSASRFVKGFKALTVCASFTACLLLLLLTCCLYTGGDWFLIAATAVLTGCSVTVLPAMLVIYPVPQAVKRNTAAITVCTGYAALTLLLVSCLYGSPRQLGQAELAALYFFAPVAASVAVLGYAKINAQIKASVVCAACAVFVLFANTAVNSIFGNPNAPYPDFTSWQGDALNANITAIAAAGLCACSLILLICGLVKKFKK